MKKNRVFIIPKAQLALSMAQFLLMSAAHGELLLRPK